MKNSSLIKLWRNLNSIIVKGKYACQGEETQERHIQPLGREEPLEEDKATHSSMLAWRIPWTEEPGWSQAMGSPRVGCNRAHMHTCMYSRVLFTFRVQRAKMKLLFSSMVCIEGWVARPNKDGHYPYLFFSMLFLDS